MFFTLAKLSVVCVTIVGIRLTTIIVSALVKYLGPFIRGEIDLKKEGPWCAVTGATDGIGKAFCYKAASQGVNVVLISRSQDKLNDVAKDIENKYAVQTRTVAVDFTKGQEIYSVIEKNIADIEIGTLVNNVGLSYPYPEYFLDCPETLYTNLINTNIRSVTFMCRIVMPQMVSRGKGTIINLSSTTCLIPSPMLSVYGASKAYVEKLSADLAAEYRKSGINVSCLSPGYVATKMTGIRQPTWLAPSPSVYVTHAMRTIGFVEHTTGYFPHSLMVGVINFINFCSHDAARFMIIRIMTNIRDRAVRRING